ncbi:MAG: LysR family transcriptional regulator [Prevotella sp.]|nr:LysR family transcriptional regulator [Prevotella sp.]
MEIRQLKSFVKLAETLNFSTAAKELFITQSTLSHQILQLENELQQPLFLRNSHEVSLTEAGQTLLPLAKETLHSADNCLLRLEELKNLEGGELNIGVTFSFASIMAETVTAFLRRYPHVKVNVTQSTMAELMTQLENHELDFVLAFKPSVANPKIDSQILFHHRLAAVVSERHALAGKKSVTFEELQRYDLVMSRRGTQARNVFDAAIAGSGYQYRIKVEMNMVYLLFKLLRESNYVTVLSESTVAYERGLRAVPVVDGDGREKQMEGCIHLLKNVYMKKSSKEFIRMLGESISKFALTDSNTPLIHY